MFKKIFGGGTDNNNTRVNRPPAPVTSSGSQQGQQQAKEQPTGGGFFSLPASVSSNNSNIPPSQPPAASTAVTSNGEGEENGSTSKPLEGSGFSFASKGASPSGATTEQPTVGGTGGGSGFAFVYVERIVKWRTATIIYILAVLHAVPRRHPGRRQWTQAKMLAGRKAFLDLAFLEVVVLRA